VTAAVVPACSVIASSVAHADPVATTATVLKVVDGDKVDVVDDVRGRLRIGLLGIDTPETKKPGYTVGCWGPEATEFAKSTLLGQRVAFVTDPSQGMYDRFGRTLAYLDKDDGWDYSVEAARAGAAHSYVYHGHPSEPTRLPLANRKRRPLAGACGDRRAAAKRRQSQSDSPRGLRPTVRPRGRALSGRAVPPGLGCRRAGVHRAAGGGVV
jgi:micrococcal nuclease